MNIEISDDKILSVITDISKKMGGSLLKQYGSSILTVSNEHETGTIKVYDLFPGMSALIYNFDRSRKLSFTFTEGASVPAYFIFCLDGNLRHKFDTEEEYIDIDNFKNIIIKNIEDGKSIIEFPGGEVPCKVSIIFIQKDRIDNLQGGNRNILATYLNDIFLKIDEGAAYKYHGRILPQAAELVRDLIANNKEGVVGRLLTESIILKLLALQVESHEQHIGRTNNTLPLTPEEFEKIMDICVYIDRNIENTISMRVVQDYSGLSQKKIQSGFRYLYQKSLNDYTNEVRLEHARELIESTDLNISEIVYQCGLNNRSHFSKIFKRRYGVLPSKYKNSFRINS